MSDGRPQPTSAVVVLAKASHAGSVKTRMCPPLSPEQAALLYAAMLGDVLAATARFCVQRGCALFVAVHPASALAELSAIAPLGARLVVQRGRGLAERMAHGIAEAAAAGYPRVALRGSDSPALDLGLLGRALDALGEAEVAISPDVDGGYNVLAVRRPHPGLLDHPMSTSAVAGDTLANARALGLTTCELERSFDLDRIEDLERLAAARREATDGLAELCPRTLEILDREGWWPTRRDG